MRKYEKPEVEIIDLSAEEPIMDVVDYSEGFGEGDGGMYDD